MNNQEFLKYAINIKQISYSLDRANPSMAVIDMNSVIQYSSNDFDKYFNNGEAAFAKSIFILKAFKANWTEIELILTQTVIWLKQSRIIIFLKNGGIIYPYIIEFLPIINPSTKGMVGILLMARQYEEHGLIFQRLEQENSSTRMNNLKKELNCDMLKSRLTEFQLTICYLITYNYTNQQIADIINLMDKSRHTSRSAINKRVDQIRDTFSLKSKNEIADLLIGLKFYKYLPSTLFKESIVVLE